MAEVLRCDGCSKDINRHYNYWELDYNWSTVTSISPNKYPMHFCSLECLKTAVHDIKKAN